MLISVPNALPVLKCICHNVLPWSPTQEDTPTSPFGEIDKKRTAQDSNLQPRAS